MAVEAGDAQKSSAVLIFILDLFVRVRMEGVVDECYKVGEIDK